VTFWIRFQIGYMLLLGSTRKTMIKEGLQVSAGGKADCGHKA